MENRDSDELNALTSQVLDYYTRYSQNPNFSSYLRGEILAADDSTGTSAGHPEVKINNNGGARPPLIGCDNNENDINVANVTDDQICNPSPTSSITSTRKLEWDNLADIGYGNCQKQKHLQKSLSLPALTALEKIGLGDLKLRLSPEGNVADNATQTQLTVQNSSPESVSTSSYKKISSVSISSTPSFKDSPQIIDSTSSFSSFSKPKTVTTETDFTDIESSVINSDILKEFHNCIGLPMAESTPNNVNISKQSNNLIAEEQDSSNKEEEKRKTVITINTLSKVVENKGNGAIKQEDIPPENIQMHELKCVAKCFRNNIKHLSLTKPLSVECANYKEISDKVIQTSTPKVIETVSVSVQTEQYVPTSEDHIKENIIYPVYEEKRLVEYIIHGNSPREPNVRSCGTNTDSDMLVSQCNSFEYLFGQNISGGQKSSSTNSPSTSSNPSGDKSISNENKLRRAHGKSNLAVTTSENERTLSSNFTDLSSKSSPLAELITTKLSKHMISDVEKSISMLQKLLKSKKYDKVTKQYYVKKIVQKIVNYDYSSESSVNSDLPSQSSDDNQNHSGKGDVKLIVESSEEPILEQSVQEKKIPTALDNPKVLDVKRKKQLEIKTFSTEILPEQAVETGRRIAQVEHQQSSKLKDARFTITNSRKDYKNSDEISQIGDTNPENTPSPRSSPQSAIETSSSKSTSFRNWKDEQTLSEKLFEQRNALLHCGDGSSNESELLLNFAKKERDIQINWINNEINHLNKLKDMLQKKRKQNKVKTEQLTEPHVEEMLEKNKTTSVYVITTERSGRSSNSSYTNSLSVKSAPARSSSKKCKCLLSRGESQSCDLSTCQFLKFRSQKGLNRHNFDKMLRKDIEMLPHLTNSKDNQCDSDIENAKLIASEIYKGQSSNSYVRRFVFEMPMKDISITDDKYNKILSKSCKVNADMQNAKLIASEVVKGILPNTHIRRYVFEIPLRTDEASKVIFPSSRKQTNSSKESTLSKAKKCKCKNISVTQTCRCADVKIRECPERQQRIEFCKKDIGRYESSDILCLCEIGKDKNNKTSPCECARKCPVKILEADVLSNPKKHCTICVKKTGNSLYYDECSVNHRGKKVPNIENEVETTEDICDKRPKSPTGDGQSPEDKMILTEHREFETNPKLPFKFGDGEYVQYIETQTHTGVHIPGSDGHKKPKQSEQQLEEFSETHTDVYTPDSGGHRKPQQFEESSETRTDVYPPSFRRHKRPKPSEQQLEEFSETRTDILDSGSQKRPSRTSKNFEEESYSKTTAITSDTDDKVENRPYKVVDEEHEESVNIVAPSKTHKGSQYENNHGSASHTGTAPEKEKKGKHKRPDLSSSSSSSSSPSDSYESSSDSAEDVPRLCLCCNRAETKYRSVLRGLPGKLRNALCEPCYTRNQQTNYPNSKPYYTYPGHVCSCYTVMKTETVRNIQRTVDELENLEREREICACSRECRLRKHGGKREKHQKSIAYTLTFEDVERTDSEEDGKHKKRYRKPLQEVRVKVPHFVKKSHKDKENRKKHKHERHSKHRKKHHHRNSKPLTLQDYLWTNRPNFVASAEERRKAMIELGYLREERCQKYKQLLAMSNGVFPETNIDNKPSKPRMFTSQEMKQITAKNYKKLPEVQRKLEENRNNQIKRANKILANIFNKKLRNNVLKGRLTLSTNTSVIKLP